MKDCKSCGWLFIIVALLITAHPRLVRGQNPAHIQYGHISGITSVSWSPDNRRIVSYAPGDDDQYIRMWEVESGHLIWSSSTGMIQKKDEYFTLGGFVWSPDQALIATCSGNGSVQIWNAADGKLRWSVDAHTENASAVAFSNDGKYLISAGEKNRTHAMKLWDIATGSLIREFSTDPGVVIAAAFSDNDKTVKTGNLDAEVSDWDVATGRRLKSLKVKSCQGIYGWSRGISFDHHLNQMGVICGEKAIVRNVSSNEIIRSVELSNDYTKTMAFSGDDDRFLVAISGYQRITDLRTGKFKDVDEYGIGQTVSLNKDGSLLAAGGGIYVATVRISIVENNQTYKELQGHPGIVRALAFSPDGNVLASGGGDGVIRLWNARDGSLLASLSGHSKMITALAFNADGNILISGSEDETLKIWDLPDRTLKQSIRVDDTIKALALSADGSRLLTTGDRIGFKLWNTLNRNAIRVFNTDEEHNYGPLRTCCGSPALSVAFSPDGLQILSGHEDGTVKIWNKDQQAPVRTIDTKSRGIRAVFSQNGKAIVTAGDDEHRTAKVWDAKTGAFLREISDASFSYILGMSANPNNAEFATSGLRDTLNLWNSETGKLVRNLPHGYSAYDAITFSADGRLMAAGGDNQNIMVWQNDTGALLWQLQARDVEVERLAAEKKVLFNSLQLERERATAKADSEIATWKNPVTITFEHYGEPTDIWSQRIGEYSKQHQRKDQSADSAQGIWLRLSNNSDLPISISTTSMYLSRRGGCDQSQTSTKPHFGLCNGQDVALLYRVVNKDGEQINHVPDFSVISVLPPGWSVFFSIKRTDIQNGQSIECGFAFLKEDEKGRFVNYGSGQTIYFKTTDIPKR